MSFPLDSNIVAIALFDSVLNVAGNGVHHLAVSATVEGEIGVSDTTILVRGEGINHLGGDPLEVFFGIFQLSLSQSQPAGMVLRTMHVDGGDVCMGWRIQLGALSPMTEAEISDAYCAEIETGDLRPTEYGVTYTEAPAIHPWH